MYYEAGIRSGCGHVPSGPRDKVRARSKYLDRVGRQAAGSRYGTHIVRCPAAVSNATGQVKWQAYLQPMTAAKIGTPRAEKKAASHCPHGRSFPGCNFISPGRCRWALSHCFGPGQQMMTQSKWDRTLYLDLNIANYNRVISVPTYLGMVPWSPDLELLV